MGVVTVNPFARDFRVQDSNCSTPLGEYAVSSDRDFSRYEGGIATRGPRRLSRLGQVGDNNPARLWHSSYLAGLAITMYWVIRRDLR